MPEWWNWKCNLAIGAIVWAVFFAVQFWPGTASGFQLGLCFYWVGSISWEYSRYLHRQIIDSYKRIIEIDDSIADNLRAHIKLLQEERNGGSNGP